MAKQGQHKRDQRDQRISRGRNNPKQSMTITTGSYKKKETYEAQARQRKDTDPEPQRAEADWKDDTRRFRNAEERIEARQDGRSGSTSNASRKTRGH